MGRGAYTPLGVAASDLKEQGVIVFVIGIGQEVRLRELQKIASANKYIFLTSTFYSLSDIESELANEICSLGKGKVCFKLAKANC